MPHLSKHLLNIKQTLQKYPNHQKSQNACKMSLQSYRRVLVIDFSIQKNYNEIVLTFFSI